MPDPIFKCPCCGDMMIPVIASLNRTWLNAIFCGWGSSLLQIKKAKGKWTNFMHPSRSSKAAYCSHCGALLLAPSMKGHRKALGLE